jgi:hypothetical protein
VITAGNQFPFQQSPPSAAPAPQYTDEHRHKEAPREEIGKRFKLLVDITGTDDSFISRSQQQNDVLLQWKKWCDDHSFNLAKRYGVFVGAMLTGFVIKDSLMRFLGTLIKIHMRL